LKGRHAKAKVLIVLKTKSFYESAPCLKELSCAIDQKIPVIPIVLEENLPGPKQQWSKLTDQDSEVMIAKVQEHLGKINDIPSPGTLLTVPITLDEIIEEINKHVTTKAQEFTTLATQNFAAKRGGWSRMISISSKRSQPSRSKPPRSPPPKESGTEMSSIVGSSMHVVNLVSWKELTLRERLGAGSFGEVRVAVYNSTPCAIKSLRAVTTPAVLQELISEFELTMRLHHPNVLLTMGIAHDADDGKTGILMELMPASLLDVLHHHRQRDQLATWEASLVLIALDVAKGMTYLHAKGVVHRDLKPGNVLLTEHWDAKVADFGTALTKYAGQAEGPAGTPPYMAPEAIAFTSGAKAKPTDRGTCDFWQMAEATRSLSVRIFGVSRDIGLLPTRVHSDVRTTVLGLTRAVTERGKPIRLPDERAATVDAALRAGGIFGGGTAELAGCVSAWYIAQRAEGDAAGINAYYDEFRAEGYTAALGGAQEELTHRCAELAGLPSAPTGAPPLVLDLGCGSGLSIGPLVRRGCAVIGIDLSLEMLRTARRAGAEVVQADMSQPLPLRTGLFDGLTSVSALQFLCEPPQQQQQRC
ncbi:serine threonine kinase, partial [Chrysochromulina tobinii]